ncbi:MAG: ribosome-associated translation inhibitor RaiA [Candidatus Aminicenantes bacterium]|nr:ribosome-associated translation inhibitor RaiA [Candidatus Aminicenantes bacterium]
MNVHITARRATLAPEIKAVCDRRLAELKKLMGFVTKVEVILAGERNRQRAEIHLQAKGGRLVVTEDSPDMLQSLNLALDSLEKKLKKEREKFRAKKRRGGRERKTLSEPPAGRVEPAPRIIAVDYVEAKPMTVEEAVVEFDLRKKDVLVFRTTEFDRWSVLFRRKDGHYGLVRIE